ncbi:M23 family metallopeptidase [Patescibacteria group bacterium]|nr:M23 family metallopeptidase [Patescibacteria group bacterium]
MQAFFQTEIDDINKDQTASQRITQTWLPGAGVDAFPKFECAIDPFGFSPRWGEMKGDAQLNRKFCSINNNELGSPPKYDMAVLKKPLAELNQNLHSAANQEAVTSKLFYSTRYLGDYDLDSDEFVNTTHPALDMKMPAGSIVRAIAGGRVHDIANDPNGLGQYIVVEHRLPKNNERVFSIYGHLGSTSVSIGQEVKVGEMIGTVGTSGNTKLPHLHLQIDKDRGSLKHTPYVPAVDAKRTDVVRWTMHPVDFIDNY